MNLTLSNRNGGLDAIQESDEDKPCENVYRKSAIYKHKETVDITQAEKDIESAKQEWENVGSIYPGTLIIHTHSEPITCEEVLNYFRSKNMTQFLCSIKPVRQRKGLDALKHWLVGPPKLHNNLILERDLLFAVALSPFDNTDSVHLRVLQTLYKSLAGTEKDCPRYGRHWEDVGFQGVDPGTDLRGVGFLGLLHLLCLTTNPATSELAKEISLLSKNEKQNFPFCAMGINMTRIVIESMRDEVLNKECNRRMDIFRVTNDFYAGVYLHLYQIWCKQCKTIMDSGYVIRDLNAFAKKHSTVIFRELHSFLREKEMLTKNEVIIQFSDIVDAPQLAYV